MFKKLLLFTTLFLIILIKPIHATTYADELPNLKKLNNYTIAKKRITKALKQESKGKYKKANKLYAEALEFFLIVNKNNPINPEIFFYLGLTSYKLEKVSDAEIYFLLGLEIDPSHKRINEYLGKLYIKTGRISKAKERLLLLKDCRCIEYEELNTSIKLSNS